MFVVGGESLIDLVSQPVGKDGRRLFEALAGGSPFNCAIALARLGNDAGFLCPISTDSFGDMLMAPLLSAGVTPLIGNRVAAPSTLAVATLDERGKASYRFYREADRAFTRDSLVAALPEKLDLFQIGGFCAILDEDATAWLEVADAAARKGALITMDPNVRPTLVSDFDAYRARLDLFFDKVNLIKLSDEDLAYLDGEKSVETHVADLLSRPNCALVVVTYGEAGSRAFTRSAQGAAEAYRPPVFGDTVGAGDSLMAGILTILGGWNALSPAALVALPAARLGEMLRFGAVTAGLNCAHAGCVPPTRAEVEAVLATN
ncbi:MAG: carbohydrate kinase [Alphaproteobacteria bacterium]|nr:carbohydrate kinase [Alphaproteobacteria bacterium]